MIVMHIDANSAYLSWTAVSLLEKGYPIDIRNIPSAIAGNPDNRHGIILTKSIPAKKYGIKTGESLLEARKKCPELLVFPPDYDLYLMCSNAMFKILFEYSPLIQRYSIDECFMDYTTSQEKFGDPVQTAYSIKNRIKGELGFTVNIGVSCNKLLAKMGSELKKPDMVHTLFKDEINEKMWKLPIEELFMVGRATAKKLRKININTIGDLANADRLHIKALLKSHGELIWDYANGIDYSPVVKSDDVMQKGVGNSITTAYDIAESKEAYMVLLSLCERTATRLRKINQKASLVRIQLKTNTFIRYSHQIQLQEFIDSASDIYRYSCLLFDKCWKGEKLRQLGVSVSKFGKNENHQISMFDDLSEETERNSKLEYVIDDIRNKFGEGALIRGTFANSKVKPIQGGVNDGNYIMMGGHES
ncbi:DNA polymerase Y family protein [Anaerovorax odorimutans]|uniref:DNA polymerase Y family protein n=1 Tax=Anaerovorax odorimutans TaxID=109327 RepID=UPI0003FEEDBC|nr:DNA polymerase IV [Anaerovorax odorimutans]